MTDPATAQARVGRFWAAFFSAATTLMFWEYVSPWAAWGWSAALLILALILDFSTPTSNAAGVERVSERVSAYTKTQP